MNLRYSARGITLIELIAYMAILIVVTQLISSIFLKSTIINEHGNKYIYSLQEVSLLQSTIKNDLREAIEIIPSLNEYKTSDTSIILRTFSAYDPANADQYIIYQFIPEANRLDKITLIDLKSSRHAVWTITWPVRLSYLEISTEEIGRRSFNSKFRGVRFTYNNEDVSQASLVTVFMVLNKIPEKQIGETTFNFSVKLRAWQNELHMMDYSPLPRGTK